MKLLISKELSSFFLIFFAGFFSLIFGLVFSIYFPLIGYTIIYLLNFFIIICLGFAWFNVYKTDPKMVIKISLFCLFTLLIGYFWFEARCLEFRILSYPKFWHSFSMDSRMAIVIVYLKALVKTVMTLAVAGFTMLCFKNDDEKKKK